MVVESGGKILILTLLATVTGCASLDKHECLNADWRTLGFQDGARGKVADVIGGSAAQKAQDRIVRALIDHG